MKFLNKNSTRHPLTSPIFHPQTVPQRYKIEAQEEQMNFENAKKFEEQNVLIHNRIFLKETPNLQTLNSASCGCFQSALFRKKATIVMAFRQFCSRYT